MLPLLLWFLGNNFPFSRVALALCPPSPNISDLPYPTLPPSVPPEWYTYALVFILKVVRNESICALRYHGGFRSYRVLGRHRPRSRAHRQRQGVQIARRLQ